MKTITLSAAKSDFFKLMDEINKTQCVYQITRGGVPEGVLLSADEYESLLETFDILSDPDLMKQIQQSKKEIEKGILLTHEEVFG
ncbi:MAG: type II toxin-antitoxin system Phd/YefM family antitoxin [bacterium]